MRIENTTTRKIDLSVGGKTFEIARRTDGVNGFVEIDAHTLREAKKDPIVAHWFGAGDLREVAPGFESKAAPLTDDELAEQEAAEAARTDEAKAAQTGADLLAAATKQSEGSAPTAPVVETKDKGSKK